MFQVCHKFVKIEKPFFVFYLLWPNQANCLYLICIIFFITIILLFSFLNIGIPQTSIKYYFLFICFPQFGLCWWNVVFELFRVFLRRVDFLLVRPLLCPPAKCLLYGTVACSSKVANQTTINQIGQVIRLKFGCSLLAYIFRTISALFFFRRQFSFRDYSLFAANSLYYSVISLQFGTFDTVTSIIHPIILLCPRNRFKITKRNSSLRRCTKNNAYI